MYTTSLFKCLSKPISEKEKDEEEIKEKKEKALDKAVQMLYNEYKKER